MGWTMILGYPASAAFYLVSFSDWFFRFVYPALSIPEVVPFWIPGLIILAILVGVNLKGTEESSQFQIVVTALKVGVGADGEVGSILLPTAGGPHAEFARETAKVIARATGATLHVVNVVSPSASPEERERAEGLLGTAAGELEGFDVTTDLIEGDDVVEAIVGETGDHDLTIIGATREGLLQRVLFGAIPEAVGQRAQNTVIMTKRYLGVRSRLAWLFDQSGGDGM